MCGINYLKSKGNFHLSRVQTHLIKKIYMNANEF